VPDRNLPACEAIGLNWVAGPICEALRNDTAAFTPKLPCFRVTAANVPF
jgi:hypothetical protein